MAIFSWSMSVLKRSEGRSVVAAAAYYARDTLHDQRTDKVHDYRDRGDLVHSEILMPDDAPGWCRTLDREQLWNRVEAVEKRKDAQLGRALRVMIPRELGPEDRITLVRNYVRENYTSRGMIADVSWHCPPASDGADNPHAHILLTLRELNSNGFGRKSRHDMIPDPEGRTHPDGRVMLVESNPDSWNSPGFFQHTRESWEHMANAALQHAGSDQRIDRRSLLARGLARIPEPALRLAVHLKELRGVMVDRWGQFVAAKHYQAVEKRAKAEFRLDGTAAPILGVEQPTERDAPARRAPAPARRAESPVHRVERYMAWFQRQLDRLPTWGHAQGMTAPERAASPRQSPSPDMER